MFHMRLCSGNPSPISMTEFHLLILFNIYILPMLTVVRLPPYICDWSPLSPPGLEGCCERLRGRHSHGESITRLGRVL